MSTKTITTVLGDIPAGQLGITLAHEHLSCDISVQSGKADNRIKDVPLLVQEMEYFKKAGGRTIVEVTPEGIGRDAVKLREIALGSGVQIVSGIAFYEESTYPSWVVDAPVDRIADYFVSQIEEGTDGVRAGLIGELMSHNEPAPNPAGYRLHELEKKVFVAAARAQRRTGVAISTHASLGRAGHAQLDVLEKAGADLSRVVIGHCDAHWHADSRVDMEYYRPILARGALCQFDMIGWTGLVPDEIRAERLVALVREGFASRITLATDTCRLSQLHANGGRGFDYFWVSFLPRLVQLGLTKSELELMLVKAPQDLLSRG